MKVIIETLLDVEELNNASSTTVNEVEIKNEIDLNSGIISFPANACIRFSPSAKLKNGTVKLNDNYVYDAMQVMWENITFSDIEIDQRNGGSFTNDFIRPEWFYNSTDNTEGIQLAIDIASRVGNVIQLAPKIYTIGTSLNIYSNTVINGTLNGAFDRNVWCGTTIRVEGSEIQESAIEFVCHRDECSSDKAYLKTCYKFRLSNFYLVNNSTVNNLVGLLFMSDYVPVSSDKSIAAPRNGSVECLRIYGFDKGIDIKDISYVEFNSIYISGFKSDGIRIRKKDPEKCSKTDFCIEFAWFNNIIIASPQNNDNEGETSVVSGIHICDGNNIYFNNIRISDTTKGLYLESNQSLFAQFFNRMQILNCSDCIDIYASGSYITRMIFSEIILYGYQNGIFIHGAERRILGDSSFYDIYDSAPHDNANLINCNLTMSSLPFDRVRAINKIIFNDDIKRLDIINLKSKGTFRLPAGSTSVELNLGEYDLFNTQLDVYAKPLKSTYPEQIINGKTKYDSRKKLFVCFNNMTSQSQDVEFEYYIPGLD